MNFVDYGNNEDVLLENIYPIKSQDGDVIDVPIQCLSVQLEGLVRSCDPVVVYKCVVIAFVTKGEF